MGWTAGGVGDGDFTRQQADALAMVLGPINADIGVIDSQAAFFQQNGALGLRFDVVVVLLCGRVAVLWLFWRGGFWEVVPRCDHLGTDVRVLVSFWMPGSGALLGAWIGLIGAPDRGVGGGACMCGGRPGRVLVPV